MNNPNSSDGRFTPPRYYSPRSSLVGSQNPLQDIRMELHEVSRALQRAGSEALETALSQGPGNLLINGRLDYWQRGTSFTGITSGSVYAGDRWLVIGQPGSVNFDAVRSVVGADLVEGEVPYAMDVTVNSASGPTAYVLVEQRVEDVRATAGRAMTFSFWAKDPTGNNKSVAFSAYQVFGTTNYHIPEVHKVQLTSEWKQYHVTFYAPTLAGRTIDGTSYLIVRLWMAAGSNYDSFTDTLGLQTGLFKLTGFKLEFGNIVTPFNPRPPAEEHALCQRYYQRAPRELVGYAPNTRVIAAAAQFPVRMRTAPSVTLLNTSIYGESPYWQVAVTPNPGAIQNTHAYAESLGILINGYTGLTVGAISMIDGRDIALDAEI